jgi:hypothetical protein
MPLKARRLIRKMRGGAQAHLLEADDGRCYVVKFVNNPQSRRILVNELVSAVILKHLGITQPETAIVELTDDFLRENPQVAIQLGAKRLDVPPGWHFGSCFPGDPSKVAVYDFLPDVMLTKVANAAHFLGVLVFDKWAGNADARQSIFLRARVSEWAPGMGSHAQKLGFVAIMIDHGYAFDGPHWSFPDSPLQGLYFRVQVYQHVTSFADFQPWLDMVANFPEQVIDQAYRSVPSQWLNGDTGALEGLLEKLLRRRRRVGDLIHECTRARINPFPNWP